VYVIVPLDVEVMRKERGEAGGRLHPSIRQYTHELIANVVCLDYVLFHNRTSMRSSAARPLPRDLGSLDTLDHSAQRGNIRRMHEEVDSRSRCAINKYAE